ncbi:hypothetical protein NKI89_24890 [Mesorhizobium sp. M0309]
MNQSGQSSVFSDADRAESLGRSSIRRFLQPDLHQADIDAEPLGYFSCRHSKRLHFADGLSPLQSLQPAAVLERPIGADITLLPSPRDVLDDSRWRNV